MFAASQAFSPMISTLDSSKSPAVSFLTSAITLSSASLSSASIKSRPLDLAMELLNLTFSTEGGEVDHFCVLAFFFMAY